MATPIRAHVREFLETVGDPMIDLLFVGISLCIRLADTFCDHLGITLRVTSIFAVLALHAR